MFEKIRSRYAFRRLQGSVWESVSENYDWICHWSDNCLVNDRQGESIPCETESVVARGNRLRSDVLGQFENLFALWTQTRFLVHVPPPELSPAGFSFFSGLVSALNFMGIQARQLGWFEDISDALDEFYPSIFLGSDSDLYLSRIDWDGLATYRRRIPLLIGLTASPEIEGHTPLSRRLAWARKTGIDFYYSFRAAEYTRQRQEYEPFLSEGYPILSLEFGANPLIHYPVTGPRKKVDYIFLGSTNYEKQARYVAYLPEILKNHEGFLAGPGWSFPREFNFEPARDRFIYACGRVGLNLSIEEQLEVPCELNERTYILAACGIPQLLDNPALLPMRFSSGAVFSAKTPREYTRLFRAILNDEKAAQSKALCALQEVFERHTIFHRLHAFLTELGKLFPHLGQNGVNHHERSASRS